MKQKIIIQVPIHCEKCRSKAMKTAVAMEGVTSVNIDQENNKLEIIGDGVDSISLTSSLRKKLSYAKILMVEEVKIQQVQTNTTKEGKVECGSKFPSPPAVQWPPCYDYSFAQQSPYTYICRPVYDPNPPNCSILLHQNVVRGFLRNAGMMLEMFGEVHVTHKTAHPFSKWEIEKLADKEGLRLVEKAYFFIWDYPGYHNKRGDGFRSNDSFPVGECSTFKFTRI
ncbi:hypothetical protein ACH5RR_038116 [Cinchona calisaya]|uniref:HMA domain-containing protein n=1 Tax=Cinchona calisaya TaxID=153742 RepID=A0ABD2Y875_9GENT